MISKCAVNGTQVKFQCSGASWWYVDFVYYEGAVDTITLEAVMDGTNITSGDFTIDVIVCYSSYEVHDAYLIVVGRLNIFPCPPQYFIVCIKTCSRRVYASSLCYTHGACHC